MEEKDQSTLWSLLSWPLGMRTQEPCMEVLSRTSLRVPSTKLVLVGKPVICALTAPPKSLLL